MVTTDRMNLRHTNDYSSINRHGCTSINSKEKLIQDNADCSSGFSPHKPYLNKRSTLEPSNLRWKQKQRFKPLEKICRFLFKYLSKTSSATWHASLIIFAFGPTQRDNCLPKVKMNIYRGWITATFFLYHAWALDPLVPLLFFLSPPMLLLKWAGAPADTSGRTGEEYLNVRAGDINFPKSPVAILPGAESSSESLTLVSIKANVGEGIGEKTDDELLF
jgi:hypothetical protein